MSRRLSLPVLPLRDTVVYPGVAVPISAGRPGTIEAVQEALDGDRRLFAVAQNRDQDDPDPQVLYAAGTVVRIIQTHRVRRGIQILVQGETRARALAFADDGESMLRATVELLERQMLANPDDPEITALDAELRERAAELATRRGATAENLNQLIQGVDDPGAFADLVAFQLDLPTSEKQTLLETLDDEDRMRAALLAVERELVRLDAQEDIQAKVQEELGERQREMLLREQLKQIRKELGEEGDRHEADELRERVAKLELGETARSEVERELRRLDRTSPQAAEYQVIRTYLEWITELPWSERTDDKIDLHRAEEILDEDHYGLDDVKDRVLEFLAVRKLQHERSDADGAEVEDDGGAAAGHSDEAAADEGVAEAVPDDEAKGDAGVDSEDEAATTAGRGPILLFAGPPGVGKTSIAKSIARSVGREYVRISLGGARDEADIRGHRRTYVGAMPGRIVQGMKEAGTKNPVFLLDEVDKVGVSFQGDPSAALLEVLDPAQNSTFIDHYLGVPFDLSEVLFIATANYEDRIPPPLHDRMEAVEFRGYTEDEKLEIARRYLLPRQLVESGLRPEELEVGDESILAVVQEYTREAGVRQLERELGKLARKVARKIASDEAEGMEITPAVAAGMLGRPRVHPERRRAEDAVGCRDGNVLHADGGRHHVRRGEHHAWQGRARPHRAARRRDEGVGAGGAVVCQEPLRFARHRGGRSQQARHSHPRASRCRAEGRPLGGNHHGHRADLGDLGAQGPRRPSHDGRADADWPRAPIGGVKEKFLGALRAGIQEVILPLENEAHLEDLPDAVRSSLTVHLAEDLHRVIELAVRAPTRKTAAKAPIVPVQSEESEPHIQA